MIFQYNLMFSFSFVQSGQVFVMVPSTNSLFSTTETAIGSTNKTTSLVQMQVVTVSTAGSGYLAQQVEQYTLARNN